MGNLKPGATYIYEQADGVTYAREFGEIERVAIGWSLGAKEKLDEIKEAKLWNDIKKSAEKNPALQEAVDRVKILYELSKNDAK